MKKPKISIIIPMYNAVSFLSEQYMLSSILKQNCLEIEIVLVNDSSTDNTLKEIQKIAIQHQNIKVINLEKNSGEAVARNVGIDNALGEYLLIFDQDDTIEENLICTLLEAIFEYKSPDLIAFSAVIDYGNKSIKLDDNIPKSEVLDQSYIKDKILSSNIGAVENKKYFLRPHWRVLYKKSMLDANNVRYDMDKRKDEDQCFLNEALWCAGNIVDIYTPSYHWIRRVGSSTDNYSPMFDNLLDNIHRYKSRFGSYYDFDSQIMLYHYVTKILPDCYDFILFHEKDKNVNKKQEILNILNNSEVIVWYSKVKELKGIEYLIQKALARGKPNLAYMVIDLSYSYQRVKSVGKKLLTQVFKFH